MLGSYAVTVRGSYPFGSAVHLTLEHLALVILTTAVVPTVALCLLTIEAVRGRIAEPELRSVVATTLAATLLISAQVGFFAARFAPHLLERDLAALPPLLFTVFAAWVARGGVRPFLATTAVVVGLGAFVLSMPWNRLVGPVALADSFSLTLPYRVDAREPIAFVALIVLVLLLAFVFVPRRASTALLVLPFALLVVTSVVASNTVVGLVESVQRDFVGPRPSWIDRAAAGNVAYFYDGEAYWNVVWQERFWNRRITQVVYSSMPVPGPIEQEPSDIGPDGRLHIDTPYVVATDYHHFVGTPVAHLTQIGLDESGLTLWKLSGAPRMSFELFGFEPNGDIEFPVTVKVFDCGGGVLRLTLPDEGHESSADQTERRTQWSTSASSGTRCGAARCPARPAGLHGCVRIRDRPAGAARLDHDRLRPSLSFALTSPRALRTRRPGDRRARVGTHRLHRLWRAADAHLSAAASFASTNGTGSTAASSKTRSPACNLLPGPASTQLAIFAAWRVAGWAGALARRPRVHRTRACR